MDNEVWKEKHDTFCENFILYSFTHDALKFYILLFAQHWITKDFSVLLFNLGEVMEGVFFTIVFMNLFKDPRGKKHCRTILISMGGCGEN